MNRPSQLVIVRHGESDRNRAKKGSVYFADDEARQLVRGVPDHQIHLTELGYRQAEETGVALAARFGSFDYAYHSGYCRTQETLLAILQGFRPAVRSKIKVRQNSFLRERDPGYAYDMTEEEVDRHFPWLKEHWKTFGGYFARPPGGESLEEVTQRVYLFLNMLIRDRAGKRILIVTHGGTIRCLRFLLERWSYDLAAKWPAGESPANCGVTVYNYSAREKRLMLKEHNTIYWKLKEKESA